MATVSLAVTTLAGAIVRTADLTDAELARIITAQTTLLGPVYVDPVARDAVRIRTPTEVVAELAHQFLARVLADTQAWEAQEARKLVELPPPITPVVG